MRMERVKPAKSARLEATPYPGLRPFEESEARLFFGRERETIAIAALLEAQQLVVVHGASGCGKSSLIRAGVIPKFRLDCFANGTSGRVIMIRPSDAGGPIAALAAGLEREFPRGGGGPVAGPAAGLDREDSEAVDPASNSEAEAARGGAPSWAETLVAGPDWAGDIAAAARAADAALCLVVDQFEEIFALQRSGGEAEVSRLIEFLISLGEPTAPGTALGDRPLSVILTMRSDYLGHCSLWDGFAETVNRAQYLLPRISTVGLLRAIHQPALKHGGTVDEAVADQLLPVMTGEIDGLPILQHALMRAWRDAKPGKDGKRAIGVNNLKRIGTAAGALSKHAEEAFRKATKGDPERIEAAEWIFRALSDLDSDGRIIRRSVMLPDLVAQTGADRATIEKIVNVFRQREFSFLTPYPPERLSNQSNISVTHEALLRRWHRISNTAFNQETGHPEGLVYREASDGMIWRALSVQAETFASNSGRVLSAAATEQRLPWFRDIARRPGWALRYPVRRLAGTDDSSEQQWRKVASFMKASEDNLEREHKKLEEGLLMVAKLRKQRRAITALSVVVLAMTVLLAGLGIWWTKAELDAEKTRLDAEELKAEREGARSSLFAAGVAQEQAQFANANEMARRACVGEFNRGQEREKCIRSRAMVVFYDSAVSQRNNALGAAGNEARASCRRRGVPEDRLTDCVAQELQQISPYMGGPVR